MLAFNVWVEELAEYGVKRRRCLTDAKKRVFQEGEMSSVTCCFKKSRRMSRDRCPLDPGILRPGPEVFQ